MLRRLKIVPSNEPLRVPSVPEKSWKSPKSAKLSVVGGWMEERAIGVVRETDIAANVRGNERSDLIVA
jgi:hypothetical protein